MLISKTAIVASACAVFALAGCSTGTSLLGNNDVSSASGSSSNFSISTPATTTSARAASARIDTGFNLAARGGKEFTIPVTNDESYLAAATQALDRCAKSGQKPTAPMQRVQGGSTVLAYSCT